MSERGLSHPSRIVSGTGAMARVLERRAETTWLPSRYGQRSGLSVEAGLGVSTLSNPLAI